MKITNDKVTYVTLGDLQTQIGKGCVKEFDLYEFCLEGSDIDANTWYASSCYVLARIHDVLDLVLEVLKSDYDIEFVDYPNGIEGVRVVTKLSQKDRMMMLSNTIMLKTDYEDKKGYDLPFVLFSWV